MLQLIILDDMMGEGVKHCLVDTTEKRAKELVKAYYKEVNENDYDGDIVDFFEENGVKQVKYSILYTDVYCDGLIKVNGVPI